MGIEHTLDVNMLPPPEPMERILAAIDALPSGHFLRVFIHREPYPLYEILEREGFAHHIRPGQQSAFELFIWRRADTAVHEQLQALLQDDAQP